MFGEMSDALWNRCQASPTAPEGGRGGRIRRPFLWRRACGLFKIHNQVHIEATPVIKVLFDRQNSLILRDSARTPTHVKARITIQRLNA